MQPNEYHRELNTHISYLYSFARQINELDFAAALMGEFRGAQDPGWNTTLTAHEVFEEIKEQTNTKTNMSKSELRIVLMLYCQLAEAGGVYETLKNIMGTIRLQPYLLWPFKDLVRVKNEPRRIIGPNANATFRDLATTAKEIGLARLSSLLEITFRDDIRNSIYHADYVIWDDGLRIRNRNGGYAKKIDFKDLSIALTFAVLFFQLIKSYSEESIYTYNPPKTIVGRFSQNFPMPWTVGFNPDEGSLGISGSSPGPVTTPEYKRQLEINSRLGGKVFAIYSVQEDVSYSTLIAHISNAGFDPHNIVLDQNRFDEMVQKVESLNLWDERVSSKNSQGVLIASPWGFRWLTAPADFDELLPSLLIELEDNAA